MRHDFAARHLLVSEIMELLAILNATVDSIAKVPL
jgi:hypothetical protein